MNKLIVIGPKSGNKGGTTVSFNYLLEELDRAGVSYFCIDTNRESGIRKVYSSFLHLFLFLKLIRSNCIISLHASNTRAAVYALILSIFAQITDSLLIIRVFGGNHVNYISDTNKLIRQLVIKCYRKHTLLLQTKGLIKSLTEEYGINNAVWFPTSRPQTSTKNITSFNRNGTLMLSYIGGISESKGIYNLLMVARNIHQYHLNIKISLYGELYDKKFLNLINEYNIQDILIYKGVLEPVDVCPVMLHSDMLLFPSTYPGEGYPGVIIEAINANLPILATDHQYISELIRQNIDGILYDKNNPEKLWDNLLTIYHNREKLLFFHKNLATKKEKFYSEYWNGSYFLKIINKEHTDIGKVVSNNSAKDKH
ncbi:MAG: glycosyltransferase [Balneolales bacterium]